MTPNENALVRDLIANLQTTMLARMNEQDLQVARQFDQVNTNIAGVHERLDAQNGRLRKVEAQSAVHEVQLKAAPARSRKHALLSSGTLTILFEIAKFGFEKVKPLLSLVF